MGKFHKLPDVARKSRTVQVSVPQTGTERINVAA